MEIGFPQLCSLQSRSGKVNRELAEWGWPGRIRDARSPSGQPRSGGFLSPHALPALSSSYSRGPILQGAENPSHGAQGPAWGRGKLSSVHRSEAELNRPAAPMEVNATPGPARSPEVAPKPLKDSYRKMQGAVLGQQEWDLETHGSLFLTSRAPPSSLHTRGPPTREG